MGEVTGIGVWRERRGAGELVELPSGNVARLRRVHVLDLAEQGQIPDPLVGMAAELVSGSKKALTAADLTRYVDVVNLVCRAAFVEPTVGDKGTNSQLAVGELEMGDRLAVYNWSHSGGRLRKFRPEQAESVDAAQSGGGVRAEAGGDPGD